MRRVRQGILGQSQVKRYDARLQQVIRGALREQTLSHQPCASRGSRLKTELAVRSPRRPFEEVAPITILPAYIKAHCCDDQCQPSK